MAVSSSRSWPTPNREHGASLFETWGGFRSARLAPAQLDFRNIFSSFVFLSEELIERNISIWKKRYIETKPS